MTKILSLSNNQILKLCKKYDKTIINLQKFTQIELNSPLLFITKKSQNWLLEMNNFLFLQKTLKHFTPKIRDITKLIDFQNLRSNNLFFDKSERTIKIY